MTNIHRTNSPDACLAKSAVVIANDKAFQPREGPCLPGPSTWQRASGDIDAKLEQFAVDAGCTPERVSQAHVPDQLTDLHRHSRSPAAPSGFPAPERSKSSTVPANHGLELDDGQRIYNARNETPKPNKHQTVEIAESKSLRDLLRSTLICCRRTRISASRRALERNKPVSADHSNMRTSTIGHEHHPIRPRSPTL
jgi:hypothetical protein